MWTHTGTCAHTLTGTHTHTHIEARMHTHTHPQRHMHTHTHTHTHTHMHTHTHAHTHTQTQVQEKEYSQVYTAAAYPVIQAGASLGQQLDNLQVAILRRTHQRRLQCLVLRVQAGSSLNDRTKKDPCRCNYQTVSRYGMYGKYFKSTQMNVEELRLIKA